MAVWTVGRYIATPHGMGSAIILGLSYRLQMLRVAARSDAAKMVEV